MPPAFFATDTLANTGLFANRAPTISRKVTLLSGENRTRGAVLGRKATAGTIVAAAAAGNTGNGAIGTLSVGAAAQAGRYRAVAIEPGANVGTFAVFAPDGREVGTAVVAVAFAGEVGFTIADGATDFISGDTFNIDVSAVTFKYLLAVTAATDGSQNPEAILAEDCNASLADGEALIYEDGVYNQTQLTYGAGHTFATVKDALRLKGIILVDATTIVNP